MVRIHPGSPNKYNDYNILQILQKYKILKRHLKYYVQIVYKKINKFSYVISKLLDYINQVYFLNFRYNFTHCLSKILITRPAFESKKDRSVKLNMNTRPLIDFIS